MTYHINEYGIDFTGEEKIISFIGGVQEKDLEEVIKKCKKNIDTWKIEVYYYDEELNKHIKAIYKAKPTKNWIKS